MKNTDILLPNRFYHIYNRAVGRDLLFTSDDEFELFIRNWNSYISPIAETYTYSLIPNHFHFMIRLREESTVCKALNINSYQYKYVSRKFASFFASYARIFNFKHKRMGKLFMLPYRRREIESNDCLTRMIYYIHRNPLHHGLSESPSGWPYSSYSWIIDNKPTWIHRHEVLEWFGGKDKFIEQHHREYKSRGFG
ncbi:MAG: hypothetical protein GY751_23415 [Bacteroidetes bacterium]|nr:hypothetical protein [Bacteroidota bacterium]